MNKIKILFICHGNICRSPMAEFYFKHLIKEKRLEDFFIIDSKATSLEEIGNDTYPGTKKVLSKYNIPFSKRQSRRVSREDYLYYDYLIIMDDNNYRNLMYIINSDNLNKVFKFKKFIDENTNIEDPWYSDDFETTYREVVVCSNALLDYIKKEGLLKNES